MEDKKKIWIGIFIGIVFLGAGIFFFFFSESELISRLNPDFVESFTSPVGEEGNWTKQEDLVFWEDERVFLSSTPHTITSPQWVYFNLTSKQFEGEIDAVWGFYGEEVKPTKAEIFKPHYINWTTDHSNFFQDVSSYPLTEEPCDYGNNYNSIHRNITYQICGEWNYTDMESECLFYNTTSSVVCCDSFDSNGNNYTAYWQTKHSKLENWLDISNKFHKANKDYKGMNNWYYLKNISIEANKSYQIRAYVNIPIKLSETNGKYFWGIKKTSDTINQAINNDRFYMLDPWYSSSWTYKKDITIDYTKVNGSQTNFPVLINITDTDLRDDALANGDDIVFANSSGDKLDHEIEYFNGTDGRLIAWVRIPTLSNTTNTTIEMYYGNADASNQENVNGVWDDNFVMVQHLQETPAGTTYDSTSYGNNGTTSGMDSADQVAGQIDGSLDFDGNDDYVNLGSSFGQEIDDYTSLTVSSWAKTDTLTGDQEIVARNYLASDTFELRYDEGEKYWYFVARDSVTYHMAKYSQTQVVTNKLYNVVGVWNGSLLTIYVDGVLGATSVACGDLISSLKTIRIGATQDGNRRFNGIIDEVRISNISRSAGWIKTEYNNQYSPDTFYSVGSEETEGAGDEEYPIFSNYWDNNGTLTDSGTGLFNVTITHTNGTVLLEIDGNNITATNLTSNVYNASYVFSSAGTYPYRWHSWGNGTSHNYNQSVERNYVVNSSDTCTYTSGNWIVDCSDYCNITSDVNIGSNDIIISGTGVFYIWANITADSIAWTPGCKILNVPNDGNELRIKG